MEINKKYIEDYERIIKTTNLQKGYQEFIKFFRYLRSYLEYNMPAYSFTNSIVENNMDYSYFQFSNDVLKSKGLKYVVTYVHKNCNYEIWLSGINRKAQKEIYNLIKDNKLIYTITDNPNKTDYILKKNIIDYCDYDNLENTLINMKENIEEFIAETLDILN